MTTKIDGSVSNYTTSFVVPATPDAVFAAIGNVRS